MSYPWHRHFTWFRFGNGRRTKSQIYLVFAKDKHLGLGMRQYYSGHLCYLCPCTLKLLATVLNGWYKHLKFAHPQDTIFSPRERGGWGARWKILLWGRNSKLINHNLWNCESYKIPQRFSCSPLSDLGEPSRALVPLHWVLSSALAACLAWEDTTTFNPTAQLQRERKDLLHLFLLPHNTTSLNLIPK